MESQLAVSQACIDGDLSTLKDFISKYGLNPKVRDSSGLAPLHLACMHGHLNIIHYLIRELNCNPETTTPNGCTSLHLACKSGHLRIAKCLITDYKCNPHCTDNTGYTPLHAASESGNLDSVKYLITENGCDPEVSDSVGKTPLHYASESGHLNLVKYLITVYHCDPQKPNSRGSIPLYSACLGGALPVVKYLVSEYHCSPNHTDIFGNTQVQYLCDHLATVKYLTNECRCNLQMFSNNRLTPLYHVCFSVHLDIVKFLLSHYNCNKHTPANNGNTLLHSACENGDLEVAEYLVSEHKFDPEHDNVDGNAHLHSAVTCDHKVLVKFFMNELGYNPQIGDNDGCIPLHYACQYGHLEATKFYITECNCNPEFANFFGLTPLHYACLCGHLAIVKHLVCELNCNPQIVDHYYQTPLHLASWNGHLDIVTFLITYCKSDPQCSDNNRNTPLHCACEFGHVEVAKYLIAECQSTLEYGNINGYTPLHLAAGSGHLAIVRYLINEHSCNCQISKNSGQTPLHLASLGGYLDITKFLISECNSNPKCSDNSGTTPLHYTCQEGHLEVAKYLITEHVHNPDYMNFVCDTPLHYACLHGHLAVVKYLAFELRCTLQITDQYGRTPLHLASWKGHIDIVTFLISECSCDPHCSDNNGNTPLNCACQNGHLEIAKYLITEHKSNPELANTDGYTPLHSAARNGHLAVVKYLSEFGCNSHIGDKDGTTPLHLASWKGHMDVVVFLITECNCDLQCSTRDGTTPLHCACQEGHLQVAKYLLKEHKRNPKHNGTTPLYSAIRNGHLAVVKYLIKKLGCNPYNGDKDGYTPVHSAVRNGHVDIVEYLTRDLGCNPHIGDNDGFIPLHYACQEGHLEVAKYLIEEHKCKPEHPNTDGYTPLHSAVRNGHLAVVKYLISELGCDPQIRENDGFTPLHYAVLVGHHHIVKFLLSDCKCDPHRCTNGGSAPLQYACQNGHLEVAKYLVKEHRCNPKHGNIVGYTPLHSAVRNGHLDVVRYLISELGCDPQIGDSDRDTPLHYACRHCHLAIVKYLVCELKCNPQIRDQYGYSPLHFASWKGHMDIVVFLVAECNCGPQCSDNNGNTPLHFVCENGHLEVAKYLVNEHKCNPKHANTSGYTPLHSAAKNGHLAVVKYLICELRCDPHIGDNEGFTPLHYACQEGHLQVAKCFITEHVCSPEYISYPDNNGNTPLHFACGNGHLEVAKCLITEYKCNPEHANANGYTPLHSTTNNGHLAIVQYLTGEIGCNFQIADKDHLTPLHYACIKGHLNIVKFLISQCKCNVECTDKNGSTPLHHACKNGHLEVAKHLITEYSCNPQVGDDDGVTPLHYFSGDGDLHFVRYLIDKHNCNPQCVDKYGVTPLHCACFGEHLDVVKYLTQIYRSCDPECTLRRKPLGDDTSKMESLMGLEGFTPLHTACMAGNTEIAEYLINNCKCDPFHKNSGGFTPMDFALIFQHQEIVELVSDIGSVSGMSRIVNTIVQTVLSRFSFDDTFDDIDFNRTLSPLHMACLSGNLESVMMCTNHLNSIPSQNWILNMTPMHIACLLGHLEIAKHLVSEHWWLDPKCVDQYGATPLQYACTVGHLELVEYLVTHDQCNCDQSDVFWGLVTACASGQMDIVEYLIPKCPDNLFYLLFTSCVCGHLDIVKYLIDEFGCDPHYTDEDDGLTPLHCTCTDAKYLLMKGESQTLESNTSFNVINFKKQDMLFCIWKAIRHPIVLLIATASKYHESVDFDFEGILESFTCTRSSMTIQDILSYIWKFIIDVLFESIVNRFGCAANVPRVSNHDISCTARTKHDSRSQLQLKSCKFDIFRYLVAEQKCNTQCEDKDGETPLHYACASGQLSIVQYLYREKISDLVHTTHSGDTPLHIACKSNQVEITEFLLSTGECDPLCKNAVGKTPVEIATSVEIRELLDHFCKGNYPLESVVKVFVLGDPLAGKTSMVKALQSNPGFMGSLIRRFQKIKVRQQTAGIDSKCFNSSDFGNVVIYDFAGQREFLTSHAAFLQNSSSQLAGLFIVVTNIAQCENNICHSLQYWVSFILQCCAHCEIKPHIIFVGSHEDQLTAGDIEQRYSLVDEIVSSRHDRNQFYKHKATVYLDCTRPVSPGLELLRHYLEESCNSIRKHAGKIDQRCYVLHRYIGNIYSGYVQGCTLASVSKDLDGNSHLLPSNPTELLPLFQTLHDKGQVLLLRNDQKLGKSWVITNITKLLERVIGSIFAPHDFPKRTSLGSTGVVAKSRIREVFPDLNADMVIGFLEYFEFCHRVEPEWINNLSELEQSTKEMTDDEYYLFPALVTSDRPLHERHKGSYHCGWSMHSTVKHQFFTTRFLHVLLLRLAFVFSQPQDETTSRSTSTNSESPAVKRRCKIWKNGIIWHDANGVSTLFEVRDLRTVVLCMICMEDSRIHCVRLRSQLIQTILKSKCEFCPRVPTEEFVVEVADDSLLQAVDECPSHSIKYLSSRISKRSANDSPDLTLINPDGSQGKRISELLYFEPYALLTPDLITKLFTKEIAKQSVSDDSIAELAKWMYPFCDTLLQVLQPSPRLLNKKCNDIHDSLGEISKQQLKCERIVETWMEQQKSATYRNLKRQLDRYSIFCGRNPLNLIDEDGDVSDDESDDNTDCSVPQSGQDQPTLTACCELQGLKRKINIPQEIGTNDRQFGTLLLEDRTGERVNAITRKHRNDAEEVNVEILKQWIAGRGKHPVTWNTLIETLRDTGLSMLAGEIAAVKTAHNTTQLMLQIDQPTLTECVKFQGRERRINISQEIGTNYTTFGNLLLEETTGERVKTIAHKHMNDSEQTTMEILKEWIAGRGKHPITWNTLTEVLHDIELSILAREIEAVKVSAKDVEVKPAEDTEDSSQRTFSGVHTGVTEEITVVGTGLSKAQLSEAQIDQPTLIECVRFRGRERRINISREIGTNYTTFGTLLLEDRTGERVNTIARNHMYDSEQTTMEILKEWIAGKGKHPVTWNTLTEVLHDIELSILAKEIEAVKLPAKNVEDRPTEDTEDSNQRTVSDVRTGATEDSAQGKIS